MARAFVTCPLCRKANEPHARYCISCGATLRPVYCSSCGTVNPEGLDACLECGNPLPSLSGIRWNPIVTVLQPTGAMSEEAQLPPELPIEMQSVVEPEPSADWLASRLRKIVKL